MLLVGGFHIIFPKAFVKAPERRFKSLKSGRKRKKPREVYRLWTCCFLYEKRNRVDVKIKDCIAVWIK